MFSKFGKRGDGDEKSGPGPSGGRKKPTSAVYVHEAGAAKRKKAAFLSAASDPKQSRLSFSPPQGSTEIVDDSLTAEAATSTRICNEPYVQDKDHQLDNGKLFIFSQV